MDLYFEMYSGISGNMTIAALLDLGADRKKFEQALQSMDFGKYTLEFTRKKVNGIDAGFFEVHTEDGQHLPTHSHKYNDAVHEHGMQGHNHAHSHMHGHEHGIQEHNYEHEHSHEHDMKVHNHEHEHSHEYNADAHVTEHMHNHAHGHSDTLHKHKHGDTLHVHEHNHEHRHLAEIEKIIDSGSFSDKVKADAKRVFNILADAEAQAHGVDRQEVHFHEVGAVDAIIDIVGTCVLLEDLAPEHIYISDLYEGRGFVRCAHGNMPVPVPAVLNIVKAHSIVLNIIDDEGEHVTPTGAAIAAAFGERFSGGNFIIDSIGIGAGSREFKNTTNILRVMKISAADRKINKTQSGFYNITKENDAVYGIKDSDVIVMETNIDDTSGEVLGFVMEELLKCSLDVFYVPVYMKKNRPAYMLSVICKQENEKKVSDIIFRHTTSIGIRLYEADRIVLPRKQVKFRSSLGDINIKLAVHNEREYIYPEYDSIKEITLNNGIPVKEAYRIVINEYEDKFGSAVK